MKCDKCGATLSGGTDTFGPPGSNLCSTCWYASAGSATKTTPTDAPERTHETLATSSPGAARTPAPVHEPPRGAGGVLRRLFSRQSVRPGSQKIAAAVLSLINTWNRGKPWRSWQASCKHDEAVNKATSVLASHPEREDAIPLLMEYFREHKNDPEPVVLRVTDALFAIRTEATMDPLVEIYRSVPKRPLREYPSSFYDDTDIDHGGAPARCLVRLSCGLQVLKAKCPELYEEIVLRAWDYSEMGKNPHLATALGQIGGVRAINRLMLVLEQMHWAEEQRQPAIDALVAIGKPALRVLCEALKAEFPTMSPYERMAYRTTILAVLAASGDATCIEPILSTGRSDTLIEDTAAKTVSVIRKRAH